MLSSNDIQNHVLMHRLISSSNREKVKVLKDNVHSFFFKRRLIFYFVEQDEYLMVVFWLVGFHNGKYLQHEKQEKECWDLGLGWRKGDLGIHWYRVQDWSKDFISMESTISRFLDWGLLDVTTRWSIHGIKQVDL